MDSNQFDFLVSKLSRLEHSLAEINNIKTRLNAIEDQRSGPQWPRSYSEVTRDNTVRSLLPAPPAREPAPTPRVQPLPPTLPARGPVPAPRVRGLRTNLNTGNGRGIPRGAGEATTTDRLTKEVSNDLFINCQLRYHERNWNQLPKKLSDQLDVIFDNVVLPRPTPGVRGALDKLRNDCKGGLTALALQHIQERREDVRNRLLSRDLTEIIRRGEGDFRKFDRAAIMARNRLLEHFSGKIKGWEVGRWLEEVDELIEGTVRGRGAKEEDSRDKQAVNTTRSVESTSGNKPPKDRQSKRRASDTDSTPLSVSNRYSVLEDKTEDDSAEEELKTRRTESGKQRRSKKRSSKRQRRTSDVEQDTDEELIEVASALLNENAMTTDEEETEVAEPPMRPASPDKGKPEEEVNEIRNIRDGTQGTPVQQAEVQIRTSLTARLPEGRIVKHSSCAKGKWEAQIRPETKVLIMSDGSLAEVKELPGNWELHCFPSASLKYAGEILGKLKEPVGLERVIIAMGYSSRENEQKTLTKYINTVHHEARTKGIDFSFLGFSIPPQCNRRDADQLKMLNSLIEGKFKENFIPPLPTAEVNGKSVDLNSVYRYDRSTAEKIVKLLIERFLEGNQTHHLPPGSSLQ